jgi:exopolysaccharide biosynthesis protein
VPRGDPTVAVITVEGDRLFRPGVTTEELATYLGHRGFDTAINLDGGRSAFVELPDGSVLPRRIPFRRIGPVGLVFSVVP